MSTVALEVADRVALVTLDRPDRMNGWTIGMERDYRAALAACESSADVAVVVVTGAGRAFCAGADFAGLDRMAASGTYDAGVRADSATPGYGLRPDFDHSFVFQLGMTKPVIACVNGPAAGVGFVLMCCADVRFAAAGAKLTTSFARLGLPAEHGLSWLLPRLVGAAAAADILLSSRIVLAEEALSLGLVSQVHPTDVVLDECLAYARAMAAECSPVSLRTIKQQLWVDLLGQSSFDLAVERSLKLTADLIAGSHFAEGTRAWREKRAPHWPR